MEITLEQAENLLKKAKEKAHEIGIPMNVVILSKMDCSLNIGMLLRKKLQRKNRKADSPCLKTILPVD